METKNWSIEDEEFNKPVITKLFERPLSIIPCLLWTGLLAILYVLLGKELNDWQKGLSNVVIFISVVNLFVCLMSPHTEDVKKYKPRFLWTQIVFSAVFIILSILISRNTHAGNEGSILWILMISFICLVNVLLTMRRRKGIDSIENSMKKLTFIGVMSIVIAGLQLIIAIPQLKNSYKSATSKDVETISELLNNFKKHVEGYVFVTIPEDLENYDVMIAKLYQKQLYTYSLFIANADWNVDIEIDEVTSDYIEETYPKELQKYKIDALKNWCNTGLLLDSYKTTIKRQMNNMKIIKKMLELSSNIIDYYSLNQNDSLLCSLQTQKNFVKLKNALNKNIKIQNEITGELTKLSKEFEHYENVDVFMRIKHGYKAVKDIKPILQIYLNDKSYKDIIKSSDELCFDIISFLNLVELKYAYDVDMCPTLK